MDEIQIFVSTYGEKCYGSKNMTPIEVGCTCRIEEEGGSKPMIYPTHDDQGANISGENPYYGELSALYWIWKNTTVSFVGLYHYNKKLNLSQKDILKKIGNHGEYDIIISNRAYVPDHARKEEYKLFIEVLREYDINFYHTYESLIQDGGSGLVAGANMLVAPRDIFDKYCEFLFPLLKKVRERIGDTDTTPYYKRYCAFFGERLLIVWVIHNNLRYFEAPVKMQGSVLYKVNSKVYGVLRRIIPREKLKKYEWRIRRSGYKK